jgi:drug/metabolite transporter (DMT)-like permease
MSLTASPRNNLIGIAFMLGAMASLPFIDVFAKILGAGGIPIVQIAFARMAFGAVTSLPFALRAGPVRSLWPQQIWVHALRAALLSAATFLFFSSLKTLPIADALAIFFVQPIIVTALGALILREAVDARRWGAVVLGFVGILVILRPGMVAISAGSLLALGAGVTLALYFLLSRWVAGGASAIAVIFQTNMIAAVALACLMPWVWTPPNPTEWAMLAALGAIASFGHFLILRAYDHAEASLLAPLAYSEMIMATILGWLVFGDFPDSYTFAGVGILVAAGLVLAWPAPARARASKPAASLAPLPPQD